jgi:hypothetical protein
MEINTMSQIMRAIAQFILSATETPTLHTCFPSARSLFCGDPAMAEPPRRFPPPWRADKIPGGYVAAGASYLWSKRTDV